MVEQVVEIDRSQLVSVSEDTILFDTLEVLKVHSTIPVLNSMSQVVACLSYHDMRTLYNDMLKWNREDAMPLRGIFAMTVKQFLSRNTTDGSYYRAPVCIGRHTTLHEAAQLMLEYHLHTIWIVENGETTSSTDASGLCLGCLTMTDIIKAALHQISGGDNDDLFVVNK